MKTMLALLLAVMCVLTGCASPLFVTDDGVSIFLQRTPEVKHNEYRIQFRFESPTNDKDVIQQIEMNETWTGIESFRISKWGQTCVDTHHATGISIQRRRMTLMPGEVRGVDLSPFGFAMLPSEWPDGFNQDYREQHKVQGEIVKIRPEYKTIYHLDFENGRLVWYIEGQDVRREWVADEK